MKSLVRFGIISIIFCSQAHSHDLKVQDTKVNIVEQNQSVQVLNEIPKKVRRNILGATVKITTPSGSHGTGTYMTYKSNKFILTAAHVVRGFEEVNISIDGMTLVPAKVVHTEDDKDLAILIPSAELAGDPIKFKKASKMLPGEKLVYAGFPGWHDVLMFTGSVAGIERWEGSKIVMHSYAWPGCSGSVVFDYSGKVAGVLIAIDFVRMPAHPHGSNRIVEDIVWIETVDSLTEERLLEIFSKL